MVSLAKGLVVQIIKDLPELQEVLVELESGPSPAPAYNYPLLYRRVQVGDQVLLNTAAVRLKLGTGGRHFILPDAAALSGNQEKFPGHIMKLRYTPWQFPVLAAEEEDSPLHAGLTETVSLDGVPVVIAPLHSMLPGIVAGFRHRFQKRPKIALVITDAAALPLALSDLVRDLRAKQLLDLTVTTGHAFGGDLEAVTIPAGLLVAKQALNPDLIIVGMGPGIVGTGTQYGFTGVEQSWIIDLAATFQGRPIAVPRISFADPRERHLGISHHSLTILKLANKPAEIGLSKSIPAELKKQIIAKLQTDDLLQKHNWVLVDDPPVADIFKTHQFKVRTMGRSVDQDPWFFQSTVTAGVLAADILMGNNASHQKIAE